ncbi:MAG: WD40 repeat domain-containing protein [Anaerolineales bacterium]|nr:WD40 repeat domain-containing protein [Anaerolineales bacterium]
MEGTPIGVSDRIILPDNAGQLEELARWGKGIPTDAAFSADGKTYAVTTTTGIYNGDAATDEEIRRVDTGSEMKTVAYTPEGKIIAAGIRGHTVTMWEIGEEMSARDLLQEKSRFFAMDLSKDARLLAAAFGNETIHIWDTAQGEELITLSWDHSKYFMTDLVISPNGEYLATGMEMVPETGEWDSRIVVYNLKSGQEIRELIGHTGCISGIAFAPAEEVLLSGSCDGTVRLWDLDTGQVLQTLADLAMPISSIGISLDGGRIFAGYKDQTIGMWDIGKETILRLFKGHSTPVKEIIPSPDGRMLLSISRDSEIIKWNLLTGEEETSLSGYLGRTGSMNFSPDGQLLASGSEYGILRIWGVSSGSVIWKTLLNENHTPIPRVFFSPDGKFLATFDSKQVTLWNAKTRSVAKRLAAPHVGIETIAFSPDGSMLAIGMSADEEEIEVLIWNLATYAVRWAFPASTMGYMHKVLFSPDGTRIGAAIGDLDGKYVYDVDVWDVVTGQALPIADIDGEITDFAFSEDGQSLIGARGGRITLWDISTGLEIATRDGFEGIARLIFSPDRKILVSPVGCQMKLWDAATGDEIMMLMRNGNPLCEYGDIAFSPDGTMLAAGFYDGTISLWGIPE